MQKKNLSCNGIVKHSERKALILLLKRYLEKGYRNRSTRYARYLRQREEELRELKTKKLTPEVLRPIPKEVEEHIQDRNFIIRTLTHKFMSADKRFYANKYYAWCIDPYSLEYRISTVGWYDPKIGKDLMRLRYNSGLSNIHFILGKEAVKRDFKPSPYLYINGRWRKFQRKDPRDKTGTTFFRMNLLPELALKWLEESFITGENPYRKYEQYLYELYRDDIIREGEGLPKDLPKTNLLIPHL